MADHHLDRNEEADQAEGNNQRSLIGVGGRTGRVGGLRLMLVHHLTLLRNFRHDRPGAAGTVVP